MHDLVIRGGLVVDGSGATPFAADIAIDGGLITAAGAVSASDRDEIDAAGKIVTPGFVDIHTHYAPAAHIRTDRSRGMPRANLGQINARNPAEIYYDYMGM